MNDETTEIYGSFNFMAPNFPECSALIGFFSYLMIK